MTFLQRVLSQSWVVVLLFAVGVVTWSTGERIKRIEYVSGLARPSVADQPLIQPGISHGRHDLIIPQRNEPTFHLLLQAQRACWPKR
jgi:hypothetical protein